MQYVSELMVDTVLTLQPSDNLNDARMMMKLANIRSTPVADDEGNFVGLITNRDLLACTISKLAEIDEAVQEEIDMAIRVSDVMQSEVQCVTPDTPLLDAAKLLFDRKCGCLPVLDGRKLVGIITEADFLRLAILQMEGKA